MKTRLSASVGIIVTSVMLHGSSHGATLFSEETAEAGNLDQWTGQFNFPRRDSSSMIRYASGIG